METEVQAMTSTTTDERRATETVDLPVLGMHCAACAARIEKALNESPGVSGAGVNFATARATVKYDPAASNPEALRVAVRRKGYAASVPSPIDLPGGGIADA